MSAAPAAEPARGRAEHTGARGRAEHTGARGRATVLTCLAVLAASSSLHAMFSGHRWWIAAGGAAVLASAIGALGRRLRLPLLLSPLLTVLALLLLATGLYAPRHAILGFIPTQRSLVALQHLFSAGFRSIPQFFSPSDPSAALLLLTVTGVGLMALAADLIAITGERPVLAGIPLLLLVILPAGARSGGIGLWSFLLTAVAYLALLAFDSGERSSRWGRFLTGSTAASTSAVPGGGGSTTGWRIGAVALVAAMALPLLIPGGRHNPFISGPGDGTGGGSNSSAVVIDPFVSISSNLHAKQTSNLLEVQTNQPVYLRLTTLENFGDNGFSLAPLSADVSARVSKGVASPDTGSTKIATEPVHQQVTATSALIEHFLPVPQDPTQVSVTGDWRLAQPTQTIFASRTTTSGLSWQVSAAVPAPTPATLRASGPIDDPSTAYPSAVQVDLEVPQSLPAVVASTAAAWVAQSQASTAYDAVLAIEQHLRGPGFTYDLNAQVVSGPAGFADFLKNRRGFCQQFASTMAAMVRTLGIPARVAIGFTPGTETSDGHYVITNQDAHAWPEVWFPTAGWVRFEPTPLAPGRGQTPSYAPTTGGIATPSNPNPATGTTTNPGTTAPDATTKKAGSSFFNKSATLDHLSPSQDGSPAASLAPSRHGERDLLIVAVVGFLVLVGLISPSFARRRIRHRRRKVPPELRPAAVWAGLLDEARDCGVRCPPALSPRAVGRAIAAAGAESGGMGGEAGAALDRLVRAIEVSRYAPPAGAGDERNDSLESDLGQVRRALRASLPARQRWLVAIFPASGVARVASPATRLAYAAGAAVDRSAGLLSRVLHVRSPQPR